MILSHIQESIDSSLINVTIPPQWREHIEWDEISFEQREAMIGIVSYMNALIFQVNQTGIILYLDDFMILITSDGEQTSLGLQ